MTRRRAAGLALVLLLVLAAAIPALAQRGRRFGFLSLPTSAAPIKYDGQFVIVRLWYSRYPGWSYDYPDMEQNLTLILKETDARSPRSPTAATFSGWTIPELLKFPIAYLSEPGYWYPSDSEALGLRTYLAKGGFLIVDDFHFEHEWQVFETRCARFCRTRGSTGCRDASGVQQLLLDQVARRPYPGRLGEQGLMGEFYGIHENNDPTKRLKVVINYNIDIGDYMEHSGRGWYAVVPTNEAFKFGVNYFIYGLTH